MATTHSLLESALSRAQAHRKQDLDDLIEELRIPSVSTLPERRDDCLRNARWLHDRFRAMGMEAQVVDVLPNKLPVVVADSPYLTGKPHLTIYGHYDVQPPDPLEEWESAPFEPAVRHGHLWARGAADNKGNHMVTVKAVEHLVAAGGRSEEHTSELQSHVNLVCRLLLEKKKQTTTTPLIVETNKEHNATAR